MIITKPIEEVNTERNNRYYRWHWRYALFPQRFVSNEKETRIWLEWYEWRNHPEFWAWEYHLSNGDTFVYSKPYPYGD